MNYSTCIYGLRCPLTGKFRYVGKSDNPLRRLEEHIKGSTNAANRQWMRGLIRQGLRPEMVILEWAGQDTWRAAERCWVSRLRAEGHPLTNVHKGGEHGGALRRPPLRTEKAQAHRGSHGRCPLDGEKLRATRKQRGLSQPALASLSGISAHSISRLENRGGAAFAHTLMRLARALDVQPEDLERIVA